MINQTPNNNKNLIVLELNELNFDIAKKYLAKHSLPGFEELFNSFNHIETYAESRYEELEPWIQWVSAHSGKTYSEHKIFRLGDGVNLEAPLVFEKLERQGLKVGAISPMNARNNLSNPAYFIPDPWTKTDSDRTSFSKKLTRMLIQTVNDNSQEKISRESIFTILEATIRSFNPTGTFELLKLILNSKGKHWKKALVLDQLIHLVHLHLYKKHKPDVSFVFLNAGAHIQHHYLFNSPHIDKSDETQKNPDWYVSPLEDPTLDLLFSYDKIIQRYIKMSKTGTKLLISTGLTQIPYDKVKYYYRLKDHAAFLKKIGIQATNIFPRMTRDFEATFDTEADAYKALEILSKVSMRSDSQLLFSEIESRGKSLFVTLTYPNEIKESDTVIYNKGVINDFYSDVVFVAIKNGMHSGKGFIFCSPNIQIPAPKEPMYIGNLEGLIIDICTKSSLGKA